MSNEYHERLGASSFLQDKITKGTGAAKTFDKNNVYQLRITSYSDFTVIINSRQTGVYEVEPGESIFFYGSPRYPTHLNLSVDFNQAALSNESILIETITAHGKICSTSPN
jgi:hypothetical protein